MGKYSIEWSRNHIISFFGFRVSKNPEMHEYFCQKVDDKFYLYHIRKKVLTIDWFHHFLNKDVTEKEIWEYIFQQCKAYAETKKIFISKFYAEVCYSPLIEERKILCP